MIFHNKVYTLGHNSNPSITKVKPKRKDPRFYLNFAQAWKTKKGKIEGNIPGTMKIHW